MGRGVAIALGVGVVWLLWPRSRADAQRQAVEREMPRHEAEIARAREIAATAARSIELLEQGRSESIAQGRCTELLFDMWGGATRYCESLGPLCPDDLKHAIVRGRTTCDRLGY
jgi:hypothetical protein